MGNSTSSAGGQSGGSSSANQSGGSSSGGLGSRIASSSGGTHRSVHLPISSLSLPFRSGGSLGLSKAELDARCQPSGLYPTCEWESKQIRRLIGDGKLAARLKGTDSCISKSDRECPICFMYYSETNISKCCNATVCTECYLQIKSQKDKHTTCPFCNNPKMIISVQGGMGEDDILKRDQEEQRVIEASIRNRAAQKNGESAGLATDNVDNEQEGGRTFGSSLESYNRSRTLSNASSSNVSATSSDAGTNTDDSNALLSVAMTPEDRRALENEMRAQLTHETHQRMQSEEEEASMRRAQEWYGSEAGARARVRDARLAELSNLLARMSARGGDNDDGDNSEGGAIGRGRGGATTLGSLIRAMESSYGANQRNPTGRGATMEDLMRLEAAFLLGMDGDMRRQRNLNRSTGNSSRSDIHGGEDGLAAGFGYSARSSSASLGRTGGPPSRVQVRGSGSRGISSTHLDTAELYMRGVSEEEQLAMAIAMSMQDQQQSQNETGQETSSATSTAEMNGDSNENQSSQVTEESDEPESSGESEVEEPVEGNGNNNVNANAPAPNVDVDGVSLDEDEEEVVFIG